MFKRIKSKIKKNLNLSNIKYVTIFSFNNKIGALKNSFQFEIHLFEFQNNPLTKTFKRSILFILINSKFKFFF